VLVPDRPGWPNGGGGIRTHGRLTTSTDFKSAPFNRSGTPPGEEKV
jgi:hypothetical protein